MPYIMQYSTFFAGHEQGWAESWYFQTQTTDIEGQFAVTRTLTDKRAGLLARGYNLNEVRISVVRELPNTKISRLTGLAEPRIPGRDSWEPATPNLALLLNAQTGTVPRRNKKVYLRGIPSSVGAEGKIPDWTGTNFLSYYNSWVEQLRLLNMGWLGVSGGQSAAVTGYTVNAQTGIVSFTIGGAGFTWPVEPGFRTTVNFSFPERTSLDGNHVVVVTDATHFTSAQPIGARPFTNVGLARLPITALQVLGSVGGSPVGNVVAQRIISRKTGRPTYAARGRSPAKAQW